MLKKEGKTEPERGVYVLIQNTWQTEVTKSELVHKTVRVAMSVGTHV